MNINLFVLSISIKSYPESNFWNTFIYYFKEFLKVIKGYQGGEYEFHIKLWTICADILVENEIHLQPNTLQFFKDKDKLFP